MKYRSIIRQDNQKTYVIIQSKEGFLKPWAYFAKADTLEEADTLIKGLSTGVITTGIYDYDKAGNRKFVCYF